MRRALLAWMLPPLLLVSCAEASADVTATYKTSYGARRVIEASETGWGRIEEIARGGSSAPDTYGLATPDGRNLTVFRHGGRWRVAEAADYTAWLNRNWTPTRSGYEPKAMFAPAGEERVGPWRGTVYRIAEDCWSRRSFVVMRGPGLEVFGRVLRRNLLYAAKMNATVPACELQAIDLMGSGLLLRADETVLESFTTGRIDPARFRLPSPVLSRPALFELLGGASPADVGGRGGG